MLRLIKESIQQRSAGLISSAAHIASMYIIAAFAVQTTLLGNRDRKMAKIKIIKKKDAADLYLHKGRIKSR
jgi:hypothetical protein